MKWGTRIFVMTSMVLGFALGAAQAAERPIVVELFTSQGCSSCPPAEAYLRDLAKRDHVIALEFHVDYWDYIDWKDKFAKREFTDRQQGYVESLKGRYKYTPQMVIDGVTHTVGSNRGKVEALIDRQKRYKNSGPKIRVRKEAGSIVAKISAARTSDTYDIVFVTFDKEHETAVKRGENRGRNLINARVVREYEMLGKWTGSPVDLTIPIAGRPGNGGCAILIQKRGYGEIIAAVSLPFDG